jgi:hypothetical protein
MAAIGLPTIPGYTLTRRIASGCSGDVYEALAPGGFSKAVKIVPIDYSNALSRRELEGVGLIRSIRHPHLVAIDRVDVNDDSITIVMELADGSLRDEFRAARSVGLAGIPRTRLLAWLSEVAEVLDFLNFRHNVRHLDVKPENLFLISGHLKIGDFGLARDGARNVVDRLSQAATPAYAAPELFDGSTARTSDQYSLAVVYCEMSSGRLPFIGVHSADLVLNQATMPPDLSRMPEPDAPALIRALHPDPERRFSSCSEFVNALLDNEIDAIGDEVHYSGPASGHPRASVVLKSTVGVDGTWGQPPAAAVGATDADVASLTIAGRPAAQSVSHWLLACEPQEAGDVFREMAAARGVPIFEPTPFRFVIYLKGGPRSWRPLLGVRDPFLLIVDVLPRTNVACGVHVVVALEHHGAKLPGKVFEQHARALMDELLKDVPLDRAPQTPVREDVRVPVEERLDLSFMQGPMRAMRFSCRTIDVSRRGLGIVTGTQLPEEIVLLHSPIVQRPFPAKIVRCHRQSTDRLFEVGLIALEGRMPPELFPREEA